MAKANQEQDRFKHYYEWLKPFIEEEMFRRSVATVFATDISISYIKGFTEAMEKIHTLETHE